MRIQSNILNRRNTVMTTKPWNGDDTSWKFEQGPENVFGDLYQLESRGVKIQLGGKLQNLYIGSVANRGEEI